VVTAEYRVALCRYSIHPARLRITAQKTSFEEGQAVRLKLCLRDVQFLKHGPVVGIKSYDDPGAGVYAPNIPILPGRIDVR